MNRLLSFLVTFILITIPCYSFAQTPQSNENDNGANLKTSDSETDIQAIINKNVYEPVIALSEQINKCYKKFNLSPIGYGPGLSNGKHFKYYVDYDEYGVIFKFYGAYYNEKGDTRYHEMDKCVNNPFQKNLI